MEIWQVTKRTLYKIGSLSKVTVIVFVIAHYHNYVIKTFTATIDELNILQASLLAMKRAVDGLVIKPDTVLVDGNRTPDLGDVRTRRVRGASERSIPCSAIVKGDVKVPAISAASLLAKVHRDDQMMVLHKIYPQYGFDRHKGYPTRQHLRMLQEHGSIHQHRKTYKPVTKVLNV